MGVGRCGWAWACAWLGVKQFTKRTMTFLDLFRRCCPTRLLQPLGKLASNNPTIVSCDGSVGRARNCFFVASTLFLSSGSIRTTSTVAHLPRLSFITMAHGSSTSTSSLSGLRRSARVSQKRSLVTLKGSVSPIAAYEPPAGKRAKKALATSPRTKKSPVPKKARATKRSAKTTTSTTKSASTETPPVAEKTKPKPKRAIKKPSSQIVTPIDGDDVVTTSPIITDCLPRTRELELQSYHSDINVPLTVIGVDEAGRGPLAGPVVAAAAFCPTNISGVIDSKKITKEEERERIYQEIVSSPGVRYAVAIVSAQRIDEINILQATLEGMRMAVEAVMHPSVSDSETQGKGKVALAERTDLSYVITGGDASISISKTTDSDGSYFALIDGNKIPKEMPCPSECLTKGDGREFCIGAASILAKVTRDRLMHEYSLKYPEFNLSQHKGYPTAAHMAAVSR